MHPASIKTCAAGMNTWILTILFLSANCFLGQTALKLKFHLQVSAKHVYQHHHQPQLLAKVPAQLHHPPELLPQPCPRLRLS
mmetsp:Transcript_23589/g.65641  ORF Transcript_23589/g.65641 Transcript_23589/m.65641 type:complete len:82 (-) Transcript_23589:362-607(-)